MFSRWIFATASLLVLGSAPALIYANVSLPPLQESAGAVEGAPPPAEDLPLLLVERRGRIANLVVGPEEYAELRKGDWDGEQAVSVASQLFERFEDVFDFVILAFNEAQGGTGAAGVHTLVRNDIQGIGLHRIDRSAMFGTSGTLQSVVMLASIRGLRNGPSLHELAHRWANRVLDTNSPAHWGFSSVGGQLGGWRAGRLRELGEGSYRAVDHRGERFSLIAGGGNRLPYAPLELYLMGLIPAEEVPDLQVAENPQWTNTRTGEFRATGMRTVSIRDLIAEHGERVPAFPEAQTAFRALYVVISPAPLSRAELNTADEDVRWFSRPGRGGGGLYNFWEATGGRATIRMDDLHGALKPASDS